MLPLLPRVVAGADCYDAISTDRPYRLALSPSECKDILSRGGTNGDLDCQVANALVDIIQESETALVGARAEAGGV
jgi:HD-GYP domain-containing protein (c-di-GMP phosphodiesterase class II)